MTQQASEASGLLGLRQRMRGDLNHTIHKSSYEKQ